MSSPPGNRPAKKTADKPKVGFYQDRADTARARAAYLSTLGAERHGTWSDFLAAAVMKEVKRLERKHHGGEPWPAADVGSVPGGRPVTRTG